MWYWQLWIEGVEELNAQLYKNRNKFMQNADRQTYVPVQIIVLVDYTRDSLKISINLSIHGWVIYGSRLFVKKGRGIK